MFKRLLLCSMLLLTPMNGDAAGWLPLGKATVSYQGPGDIVAGALWWGGLRAYNAAYATGANKAIRVCDTASGVTCSDVNILSNGYVDRASAVALAQCATSCNVATIYDQSGNVHDLVQGNNSSRPILLFAGCPASTGPAGNICIQTSATSAMPSTTT